MSLDYHKMEKTLCVCVCVCVCVCLLSYIGGGKMGGKENREEVENVLR